MKREKETHTKPCQVQLENWQPETELFCPFQFDVFVILRPAILLILFLFKDVPS